MGCLLESQLTPQGTYKCDAYPHTGSPSEAGLSRLPQ
jgi:hypothetical protein